MAEAGLHRPGDGRVLATGFTLEREGKRLSVRVGLVLGAGGVLGGAWLTGGLHALAEETDWDPGSAEFIVGTSAGSMIGALVGAGVPPWFMVAHSRGETFTALTGRRRHARVRGRPRRRAPCFRLHRGLPAARARARCAWRSPRSRTRSATRRSSWWPAGCRPGSSPPTR